MNICTRKCSKSIPSLLSCEDHVAKLGYGSTPSCHFAERENCKQEKAEVSPLRGAWFLHP